MSNKYSAFFSGKIILVTGWLALPSIANAQNSLLVEPKFFHLDSAKNIILINAPLSKLNTEKDELASIESGGRRYELTQPVTSLSTRTAYHATAQAVAYTVYFTQLPVLHLDTKYKIVDTPSVYANLVLTDSSGTLAQSATGIEIRGGFSQSYPKKSYELSLWADTTGAEDQDLALLGMRNDNKWNLQALYNDPLRLRLPLANELWLSMNQLYYQAQEPAAKSGIASAYTEVFLNDSYQGVYALTERIDRKQLKIKKYSNNKIAGELYKGIDGSGGAVTFSVAPAFDNTNEVWGGFEYKEPSEKTDWTALHDYVDFVITSSDADFYNQYKSKLNLANAVDYFILLNLMRATDNTGKNVYIAKYKAGEPYYYVPWDLDGVLGNDWRGMNVNTTNDLLTNGLYERLLKDTAAGGFQATLASRWAALRASVLAQETILSKLKQHSDYLLGNSVYEREHLAWTEYQYDAAQLTYPAEWLASRLTYLDGVFSPNRPLAAEPAGNAPRLQLYPNPASGQLSVAFGAGPGQLSIQSLAGVTVLHASLPAGASQVDISALAPGLYLARVQSATATAVQKLLVR